MRKFIKYISILMLCCWGVVTSCRKETNLTTEFNGEMISLKGMESVPNLPRIDRDIQTIDLTNTFDDPGVLDFGNNVKDYHLIFLETNKNCVIGEINKVTIIDSFVFVLDTRVSNALFMFRYDGSFVRCIGSKGKGPGEYIQATDFYVDGTKGVITLYDQFKASFLDYSLLDGSYKDQKRVKFRFHHFSIIGNRYILEANAAPNDHIPAINQMAMLVGSEHLNIESASLPKTKMKLSPSLIFKIDNNTASINLALTDTIYHTDGTFVRPMYYLKFNGESRLPDNYREQSKYDYLQMKQLFPRSKYSFFTGVYAENTSHLFFQVYYKNIIYHMFYNKQTRRLLSGTPESVPTPEPTSPMNFFDNMAPISNFRDMFISVKRPTTVSWAVRKNFNIEEDTIQSERSRAEAVLLDRYPQLKDVSYDDNPILVTYSLK